MSERIISKKTVPIIVIAWILSLVTTLALVYVSSSIFPPLGTRNIGDDTISSDKIMDGAIITTKLDDGTVSSAKILDGTITATDLADGSVVTLKIEDGAITAAKIANGVITSAKIADSAIINVKLANDSVTSAKIADGNVTTNHLADGAIVTIKLADGAVTSAKILDATITAADIATGAISSIKIADGAVTTSKIANYAVTGLKLGAYAIPHNVTSAVPIQTTTSTTFVDIPGMSVGITLTRNSTLVITVSAQTWVQTAGNYIYWRAMVNSTQADPVSGSIMITGNTDYDSSSYTFVYSDAVAGFYTVKIQWKVYQNTNTGSVGERTLAVIALPS